MTTVATALCAMFRAKLDSLEIMAAHAHIMSSPYKMPLSGPDAFAQIICTYLHLSVSGQITFSYVSGPDKSLSKNFLARQTRLSCKKV